jgi:amino acid permease
MNPTTPTDRHVGPPIRWVIGFMYLLELLPRLHHKFLQIYSNFYANLNSSSSLNSNFWIYCKIKSRTGPIIFVLLVLFQILSKFKRKLKFKFKFIPNLARIQIHV